MRRHLLLTLFLQSGEKKQGIVVISFREKQFIKTGTTRRPNQRIKPKKTQGNKLSLLVQSLILYKHPSTSAKNVSLVTFLLSSVSNTIRLTGQDTFTLRSFIQHRTPNRNTEQTHHKLFSQFVADEVQALRVLRGGDRLPPGDHPPPRQQLVDLVEDFPELRSRVAGDLTDGDGGRFLELQLQFLCLLNGQKDRTSSFVQHFHCSTCSWKLSGTRFISYKERIIRIPFAFPFSGKVRFISCELQVGDGELSLRPASV